MLTQAETDAAVAHCARRGYSATFGLAKELDSGKPSGGVGILVKEGLNIGITRVAHDYHELEHRLLAVAVQSPGGPAHLVASVYFEDASGFSQTNLASLAQVAILQHES